MKKRFQFLFERHFIIPSMIIFALVMIFYAVFSYMRGQSDIEKYGNLLASEMNIGVSKHVERFFSLSPTLLLVNKESYETGDLDSKSLASLQRRFIAEIKYSPYITFISFGNTQGEYIGAARSPKTNMIQLYAASKETGMRINRYAIDSGNKKGKELAKGVLFDARKRPWYTAAIQAQKPVWYPVYSYAPYSGLGMGVSTPLYNAKTKTTEGVITVDLSLEQISTYLKTIDVGKHGIVFIEGNDGNLIATSSPQAVYTFKNGQFSRYTPISFHDARINEAYRRHCISGESFSLNGTKYIFNIREYTGAFGLNFRVGIIVAQKDFVHGFEEQLNVTLGITMLVSLIGLGIIYLFLSGLQSANRKLHALSATDELTGLFNRRRFLEEYPERYDIACRYKKTFTVLMIDIDFFKQYNDYYGHVEGDSCLKRVANALMQSTRRGGDFVARYGGEEFVILSLAENEQEARTLAQQVRQSIEELSIGHKKAPLAHITISVGAAIIDFSRGSASNHDMLREADEALYESKQRGRNRVTYRVFDAC